MPDLLAILSTFSVRRRRSCRLGPQQRSEYPEDLNELTPAGYLKQLPSDPYSDGMLKYERRGEDFVLYSLGADFDDDGGVQTPNDPWAEKQPSGDHVFWPVNQPEP